MSKITVTYERIDKFLHYSYLYLNSIGSRKTKLRNAIERVSESIRIATNKRAQKIESLRIDAASVDERGDLIITIGVDGQDIYSFKPDKLNIFKQNVDKISGELVDIDTFVTDNYKDLSWSYIEAFKGIIIPQESRFVEIFDEDNTVNDSTDPLLS